MKQKKWHMVRVEWEDSASRGSWRSADTEAARPRSTLRIVSVGYLLRKTKREIVLFQSHDDEDKISDTVAIPMGCVHRIRKFKEG